MDDNKIKSKLKFKYTSRLLQGCNEITEGSLSYVTLVQITIENISEWLDRKSFWAFTSIPVFKRLKLNSRLVCLSRSFCYTE